MNALLADAGLTAWKPLVTAMLLPPVPLLGLILVGAFMLGRGRRAGAWIVGGSAAMIWLGATSGAAETLERVLLKPPVALTATRIAALAANAPDHGSTAIVALGGGMETLAPEYGTASLRPASLERLRYGVWLARATGLPLAFSGGVGHAQRPGADSEAGIAQRIAAQEYGLTLRWVETRSRDTRENAALTVALLRPAGVRRIVLVTHAWHMPRAMRAFTRAAGPDLRVEAAPMGLARGLESGPLRWMPSASGFRDVRAVIHEWLGWIAGA